ncbi:MAG: undecaprenyldiphospho-muramoylpentapeptide beta-N-acetylglucosaminyltransferase [Acidobacteria bacterium]|nr:undecaprenyldiphospho-muramoylpentapeptide beta-N-acetylglucosaminyltransferase [Acidobacteriota bacterium]
MPASGPAVGVRRILMVAGGTGGHIYPALAVADELRERAARGDVGDGFEIMFLGTNRELESRLIPAAGFPLRQVAAAGLKGIGGWRRIQNLLVLPRTAVETALVLRDFSPDVVVGIGSYLAGPVMLEAALKDIPTLLIEPNAVPGFTNRVLAPVVRLAAVASEEAAAYFGMKARVTGQPVRKEFARVLPKAHEPPFTVFIMGGSQGSAAINQCVMKSLPFFKSRAARLRFVHQTGERDYNAVRRAFEEAGLSAEVQTFVEDIPGMFARADLVISRAGATAVAELAAAGKAALLIPFPGAADHHQLQNARAMERAAAAQVIEQDQLTPERLLDAVFTLLDRPEQLVEMERAARRRARPDAAEHIADLIESLVSRS